jgi:hypothetical protein
LEDGKAQELELTNQTFGANIHNLLANDFFMKHGFIGEWAKQKINKIIDELNEPQNSTETQVGTHYADIMQMIEVIGDPIIKRRLEELMIEKFGAVEERRQLEKRLDELTKRK